jgi:hypothetical protein
VSRESARSAARDEVAFWLDLCFGRALEGAVGVVARRPGAPDADHFAFDVNDLEPILTLTSDLLAQGMSVRAWPSALRLPSDLNPDHQVNVKLNESWLLPRQRTLVLDVHGNPPAIGRCTAAGASVIAGPRITHAYVVLPDPRPLGALLALGRQLRQGLRLASAPRLLDPVPLPGSPSLSGLHVVAPGRELTSDDLADLRGLVRLGGAL